MATFIPNIQGNIPDLELYTPNFELMENWLSVKQERYNQGRMAVSQAYSTIANLPLTDESNIAKKDQFIKDAQNQIQKLASVDLSLEENVIAARQIFNPLLQDENIMADATFTSKATALMQANANFKNSSDSEDRARYNANNNIFAQLKLEEFKMSDAETRKSMASQSLSFVDNINLFERYLEIAKKNGFSLKRESKPTDAAGNLMPFMVTETNGKEITPLAYSRLANVFNNDPYIQEYYQQQGYIQVQSELQELIPQVGYQAALAQVTDKYQSTIDPSVAANKKAKLEEARTVNNAKKRVYESKATKVGIIPGSKEHMEYLKITAEEAGFSQEHKSIVDESKQVSIAIQDISSLYRTAGKAAYETDLNAAATDYAMQDYSIGYKATPNYGKWVDARKDKSTGSGSDSPSVSQGLLPGSDTAPITYISDTDTDVTVVETNENALKQKQVKLNKDLVDLIGTYTKLYNTKHPDEMTTEKIPNTGIRDVTSASAWWERTSESELAGQETQRVLDFFNKLDKEGILASEYPQVKQALNKWKGKEAAYIKAESTVAQSYSNSFKNVEAEIALNSNDAMASTAPLVRYMYDSETGIESKKQFEKNVLDAYKAGDIDPIVAEQVLNLSNTPIKPSFNDILEASEKLAKADYMNSLPPDEKQVSIKNDRGEIIGYRTAWENLSDNKRSELLRPYIKDARENPQSIVGLEAREGIKSTRRLGKFYDQALTLVEDFYKRDPASQSAVSMLNPTAVILDGAPDAIEIISSNLDVAPNSALPNKTAQVEQQVMLATLNRYLESGDIVISSGEFNPEKAEAFKKGKIKGDKNQERMSYSVFSRFYQDIKVKNDAKTSTATSDPRATFKVLSAVDFGNDQSGAIVEINYNTGWLQGVSSTADDPGFKFSVDGNNSKATLFIPEGVAGMMNLPVSEDIENFTALTTNGIETIQLNNNAVRIEYDAENKLLNYTSTQKEFNPKTGKYRTVTYESPSSLVANPINYRYLSQNLYNELMLFEANQEEAERLYNEDNGAVYSTDELNR